MAISAACNISQAISHTQHVLVLENPAQQIIVLEQTKTSYIPVGKCFP